jgi:hypothetical protein
VTDERGGIIGGFLIKIVILFAILGLCLFEAGSIIVARVAVDGISIDAAKEAAISYGDEGSTTKAKRACEDLAERAGAECVSVKIRDGFVYVRVRKDASTLVVHSIGPLKKFTVAVAEHGYKIP